MDEPEVQIPQATPAATEDASADVEMGGAEVTETVEGDVNGGDGEVENGDAEREAAPVKPSFIDYLKSPMVELIIGSGDEETLLRAHQALLIQSPYFADECGQFTEDTKIRRIKLADEDLDAVGSFLQFLYTGEYFPKKLDDTNALEHDPSAPSVDETGDQLLKHARVYTLADKLGVPDLKTLAHSKIHRINTHARAEIVYARYVYGNTPREDTTIRKPVAAFWAHRSHVLRHDAEDEFKKLCLEFPEFGFDVLSLVLDSREKGRKEDKELSVAGERSARKRARTSNLVS